MSEENSRLQIPNSSQNTTVPAWVILLVTVAGTLLRMPELGYSFFGDEGFSLLRDSSQLVTDTEDRCSLG